MPKTTQTDWRICPNCHEKIPPLDAHTCSADPIRCEQIAREILSGWKSAHKPPEEGMGFVAIFPEHWEDLAKRYGTALQAAKQQGREEAMESWRNQVKAKWGHKTQGKCECAYCRRDFEVVADHAGQLEMECEWLKRQQQPKSEPSRECQEIANDLVWTAKGRDSAMVLSVAAALQAERDKLTIAQAAAVRRIEEGNVEFANLLKRCERAEDELNALREEVLGVISPITDSSVIVITRDQIRAAKALRDKLKASQPTLPQPQMPHQ